MKFRALSYIAVFILGCIVGAVFWGKGSRKTEEVEISHSTVVHKIESVGNLEVARYNVQDIMEYKKVRQWLPNAKTALLIRGEVVACIDLTRITEDRVTITNDSVALLLPAPEICHIKIDHSQSKIYDITYGLWESAELMDEAYKYAQKELEVQAHKINLTNEAKQNAQMILEPMLLALGFKHITIIFDDKSKFVN